MENMKAECSWAVCAVMFLLLVFLGGCWAACGCRGTSKLYIQYKPPVSGWYTHSPRIASFKREVTISGEVTVSYFLNYTKRGKWLLIQKSSHGKKIIAVFGSKSDPVAPLVRIFCPAPKCPCRGIVVDGVSYLKGGVYYRDDIWNKSEKGSKIDAWMASLIAARSASRKSSSMWTKEELLEEMKQVCREDNAVEEENLPLSDLSDCIRNEAEVNSSPQEPVGYTRQDGRFKLTQAPEGDFWWFEANDGVFAASKEGAPCPENLPDHTEWLIVNEENRLEVSSKPLNLSCVMGKAFADCPFYLDQ